jgi:small subunit ribosomal protein S13e
MGRMQSKGKGKGISSTVTPFKRRSPKWSFHTTKQISELIVTMAKKGMSPSQIGVSIRDKEAVPSIKLLTGQKIVRLLKKYGNPPHYSGCAPQIPEDLYCLIKKAVNIKRHL